MSAGPGNPEGRGCRQGELACVGFGDLEAEAGGGRSARNDGCVVALRVAGPLSGEVEQRLVGLLGKKP